MDGRATIFNWFDLRLRIIQKAIEIFFKTQGKYIYGILTILLTS